MNTTKKSKSIESKLKELEGLLEELESGKLDLDEALIKFEKGIKLSRECQQTLEEAELATSRARHETPEAPLKGMGSQAGKIGRASCRERV